MPSLSAVRASNRAWKPAFRPVVVVAGGTNGIGAGIATAFAKYSPQDNNAPHIILIGRNRQGADSVIAEMKKVNSAGIYDFVQADLSLMKNVQSVVKELSTKVDGIDFLCMSPGILTLQVKDDTAEGIDRKMALHYYSRFSLANLLLPKLKAAVEKGEDGRVLTVLAAGIGGKIDPDDLGLKKYTGLKRKADSATTYNDLMVEELAIRNPSISFTHSSPGIVDSNITSNLPAYMRIPLLLAKPLAVSVADSADYMIYNLLRPENKSGSHFVDNKGNPTKKSKYYGDEALRKKVWDHSAEVTGVSGN